MQPGPLNSIYPSPSLQAMLFSHNVLAVCIIPVSINIGWREVKRFPITVLIILWVTQTVSMASVKMHTLCIILLVVPSNFVQDCN